MAQYLLGGLSTPPKGYSHLRRHVSVPCAFETVTKELRDTIARMAIRMETQKVFFCIRFSGSKSRKRPIVALTAEIVL